MYKDSQFYVAHSTTGPINIIGKMANRHGLIAGACRDILSSRCTLLYGRYEGRRIGHITTRQAKWLYREAMQ